MKAGQLELLQKLFGVVYIPEAVYRELTDNEAFSEKACLIEKSKIWRLGRKIMESQIRNARLDEYKRVDTIMKQVQQMHIDWRPDIYKYSQTVLPLEVYEQAVNDKTFFVAEYKENIVGILFIVFRHIESPNQMTRNIIFVDSMAVDEKYRGKGIGHAFFHFLRILKMKKDMMGLNYR